MEKKRECFFFLQLSIEVALDVVNFRFHTCVREHEEVRMSAEQVSEINRCQSWPILLDQIKLLSNQISSILQSKLREVVKDLDYILSLNSICLLEVIKEPSKIGHFASKQAITLLHKFDDLFLTKSVFAEVSHELIYLARITAVQIWKGLEDVVDLLLRDLVVDEK